MFVWWASVASVLWAGLRWGKAAKGAPGAGQRKRTAMLGARERTTVTVSFLALLLGWVGRESRVRRLMDGKRRRVETASTASTGHRPAIPVTALAASAVPCPAKPHTRVNRTLLSPLSIYLLPGFQLFGFDRRTATTRKRYARTRLAPHRRSFSHTAHLKNLLKKRKCMEPRRFPLCQQH